MTDRYHRYPPGEIRDAYLFILPVLVLAVGFILVPVVGALTTSLSRDVSFLPLRFAGLDNYARLAADPHFWQSVRFTLFFVGVSVAAELVLGMILALVLDASLPGRGFLHVAVLIPWAIPIAVSARMWELIFNFDYGVVNFVVLKLGLMSAAPNWLGSEAGAFGAIVISDVWKTTPFMAIILLAGLAAIPQDIYKQAMVDGATLRQRFFHITLPLLRPVLLVALLFRTIDAVRIFDLIYVLTGGGPGGGTTSLSLYAFKYYTSGDFGYASAISLVVFLVAGLLAVFYVRVGGFGKALR
jgi:multiple sugar transport system permease protein